MEKQSSDDVRPVLSTPLYFFLMVTISNHVPCRLSAFRHCNVSCHAQGEIEVYSRAGFLCTYGYVLIVTFSNQYITIVGEKLSNSRLSCFRGEVHRSCYFEENFQHVYTPNSRANDRPR